MADAAAGAKGDTGKPGADKGGQPDAGGKPAGDKPQGEKPAGDKDDKGGTPAGDKPDDQGKPKGEDPPARVVPDKYTLKAPEGAMLAATELSEIAALAKSEKWTNEEAQAHLEAVHQARVDESARYLTELTADKDYGGDKLAESQRLANMALDRIRPKGTARGDALRQILVHQGLGNNVHFVSMLADIGKLMDEDKPLGGKARGMDGGAADRASKFYDHPTSQKLQEQTTRS